MVASSDLLEMQSLFKPIGRHWNDAKELLTDSEDRFSSIFSNMLCCAICGLTKLINKASITHTNTKVHNIFGMAPWYIWYRIANYFIAKYTINATGNFMNICNKCKISNNPINYCPYVVTMTLEYLSRLLRLNPLKIHMLSFLNISILLEDRKYGFVLWQISDTSLLNSPMLCGGNAINVEAFFESLVDDLQSLLEKNLFNNPWFSIYLTNFKKTSNWNTGMCVLSAKVVQSILEMHSICTRLIDNEDSSATVENLSLLLNIGEKEPANYNKDYFFVGNLMNRINLKTEKLYVCPYHLHMVLGPNISL